jgi:glucokinase
MNNTNKSVVNLVADIGGTNIRLAIASPLNEIMEIATYQCIKFANLIDVIRLYISEKQLNGKDINACLAIACPVDNDFISMTNLPWQFSQKELKEQLKLNSLAMINDYTAIALAIPYLNPSQKVKIGNGEAVSDKVISVCGPGTGLGVATLVPLDNKWHCISGEGGHVDFAPVNELEIKIFSYIHAIKKRVSYEQLLSGYGLEQIYQALVTINNENMNNDSAINKLSAEDISSRAIMNLCTICKQALEQFCQVLGSFAGNLALTANSLGGVYIAGGIVPRFVDFLEHSGFRERFEAKGRLSPLTQQAPTYVITETQPGLLGASAYLNQ